LDNSSMPTFTAIWDKHRGTTDRPTRFFGKSRKVEESSSEKGRRGSALSETRQERGSDQ